VRREGKLKKSKFSNHFFYFVFLGAIWMALAVACLKMAKWSLVEGYQSLAGEIRIGTNPRDVNPQLHGGNLDQKSGVLQIGACDSSFESDA
jgi:hypothetical protein